MPRLITFNQITLDGYFAGPNGDLGWAHASPNDAEWDAFVQGNASGGGVLVFGRVTYELMASFWPTEAATKMSPVVAEGMNRMPKIVFSRTLDEVAWRNTRLVREGLTAEIRKMKREPGPDMCILGSGTIVSQLAKEGLIDEYQIVINPTVLGKGRTLFEGVDTTLTFKHTKTRTFRNGNVLNCYEPRT